MKLVVFPLLTLFGSLLRKCEAGGLGQITNSQK